ncbi:transposon Tf2-6 polyprotein [Trichonephila clavata]|uniref:Transposon Tf2-6 polyprotein n=1 Tax=Trichonephila clavata TaxID=2740835 RepID=A0A8X6I1J8_TRICU|nr:transposon Tf2-6 polyprotein [Trichonephila clavata]
MSKTCNHFRGQTLEHGKSKGHLFSAIPGVKCGEEHKHCHSRWHIYLHGIRPLRGRAMAIAVFEGKRRAFFSLVALLLPKRWHVFVFGTTLRTLQESNKILSFIEISETYLDVQNVPIANRAKGFVSSLSAKLYQLLKNLLAPDIPSDQTLDKLKDALKKHLTPKPLIIPSRHKFLNRKQNERDGISTYIAELRALAMNCNYDKDMFNIMLRDVFVSGLRDKMILDRGLLVRKIILISRKR